MATKTAPKLKDGPDKKAQMKDMKTGGIPVKGATKKMMDKKAK